MEGCCRLTINPYKEGRVIYDKDNFIVFPALGSMGIEGYLLITSKNHYLGMGEIPFKHHKELDDLIQLTRARIKEAYGKDALVFEHGPKVGECGWGGCIEHAHLHVVPGVDITDAFAINLLDRLEETKQFYRVDRIEGLKRATEILEQGQTSYVMLEPEEGVRYISEVGFQGESQWLRKLIALNIGTNQWNWRKYPYFKMAMKTAETLMEKL